MVQLELNDADAIQAALRDINYHGDKPRSEFLPTDKPWGFLRSNSMKCEVETHQEAQPLIYRSRRKAPWL